MKRHFILLIVAFCIISLSPGCGTKPPSNSNIGGAPNTSSSKFVEDILANVNQYRHSKGLAPLALNNVISAEAETHSQGMAEGRVEFGHDGFSGRIQRISSQLGPAKQSAENVAYGTLSAEQVVSNWINSPAHRQNIEGNFTLTGIGTAKNKKGVIYFTQIFIRN